MHEKDPTTYGLITYLWVVGLSVLGGIVSIYRSLKNGVRIGALELFGETATSAFAGLITFWWCEAAGFGQLTTACLVGIAGHMGGRLVESFETWLTQKLGYDRRANQKGTEHDGTDH